VILLPHQLHLLVVVVVVLTPIVLLYLVAQAGEVQPTLAVQHLVLRHHQFKVTQVVQVLQVHILAVVVVEQVL
jgi:hypothetical protein